MSEIYIVDVFAEEKYAGNQLAVVLSDGWLDPGEMQKIAREMHFSETTFICAGGANRKGGYEMRIFTPETELPFAGHPSIGTAFIIQQELIKRKIENIQLNTRSSRIPVSFTYIDDKPDVIWMKMLKPEFGGIVDAPVMAEVLGLDTGDMDDRYPSREVFTGLPAYIVPLKSLKALQNIKINREKYFRLVKNTSAKLILAFCPETRHKENHLSARAFADYYGISEDPATGSANGSLAGYLLFHSYFPDKIINIRTEQGYEINRPSTLYLKAGVTHDNNVEVLVGGKCRLTVKGKLA